MKLKNYLIISYLVALIIPICCSIIIFRVYKGYNHNNEVKDYLEATQEFSEYEELVSDPSIYTDKGKRDELNKFKNNTEVVITLYNNRGLSIFSTATDNEYMIPQEYLYQNLNEIQYGGTTYTLKKPVFDDKSNILGFYEISIARERLRASIRHNLMISIGTLAVVVLILFVLMVRYINKRFNTPLQKVTEGMNNYAKGNSDVHIDYEYKDEVGELCKHFNEMKDNLEQSKRVMLEEHKAKEYMIATISHDLKTPLTAIRAYSEMIQLEENIDKEREEEYIETIISKCDYMRDMLDDLLTYNLLTMNYQLSMVEVEGEEFCEMLFSGVEATCASKNITFETTIDVNGSYNVDVKYMTRVIDNIVSNAIRHTPVNGHIWAGAFSTDVAMPEWLDQYCIEATKKYPRPGMFLIVKNEGKVISDKDKENLFKPFYQGDEARSKKEHKGVGLGLSISKMIMEKHKGYIEAVPIKDVGNAMICYLNSTSYRGEE